MPATASAFLPRRASIVFIGGGAGPFGCPTRWERTSRRHSKARTGEIALAPVQTPFPLVDIASAVSTSERLESLFRWMQTDSTSVFPGEAGRSEVETTTSQQEGRLYGYVFSEHGEAA
jgi:hypothetical protein